MSDEPKEPVQKAVVAAADSSPDEAFIRNLSQLIQSDADFKRIPPQKRDQLIGMFATHTELIAKYHSGPLPAPEDLQKYNEVVPDGANRIMVMAENQSAHRIEIESTVIRGQQTQSGRGQIFGLVIGIFGISVGAIIACMGHDVVGGTISGTTVVSLATAFIVGKQQQAKDLGKKREAIPKTPRKRKA